MSRLAFVDIETTGLDVDRAEVWEVGLYIESSDPSEASSDDGEYSWLLPVSHLGTAEPEALKLSGFYERHPDGGAKTVGRDQLFFLPHFAREFESITRGATLVGANVRFDERFLDRLLRAQNTSPSWHYRLCDVEALAQGAMRNPLPMGLANSLNSMAARLILVTPEFKAHNALEDAKAARCLYHMVVNQFVP